MVYGELGRYPVEISIKSRVIGFWNRMIHGKETKLSFLLYQCMLHSNTTVSKWVNNVKNIQSEIGRPDRWRQQYTVYLQSLSRYTKKILFDQFIQSWRGQASRSHKALAYFNFKQDFCLENILLRYLVTFYILFFKLRTCNHKLPIEIGRWNRTEIGERKCNLCPAIDIGDEFHFVCKCSYFSEERSSSVSLWRVLTTKLSKTFAVS